VQGEGAARGPPPAYIPIPFFVIGEKALTMSNVTEKTLQTKKGDFSTTPSKNVTFAYRFRLFPMQKYNRKLKQPNN
jgi:hypothetical protein